MRTLLAFVVLSTAALGQSSHVISASGTRFLLDGKPFPYTGLTFFHAIYNPAFNKSSAERKQWMEKFRRYGINVLRIWGQWDSRRGYADVCDDCTLYYSDGRLRQAHVARLKEILTDANSLGMVVELVLFAQESWHANVRLEPAAADRAVAALAKELLPYRNVIIQIWNEFTDRTLEHVKTIKAADPRRLVSSSPGGSGILGDRAQNEAFDYLSPHTSRQNAGRHWEIAPRELEYLLRRYRKPVVDDEPARNGTPNFGGPQDTTYPFDQILQIYQVWQLGVYIIYHHDMFQTGYGTPAVPPHGIPDPEFSPYHRRALEFIALRDRYTPAPR